MKNLRSRAISLYNKIKKHFSSFSAAMKAAWRIAKGEISFAKVGTGEVRSMKIDFVSSISESGLVKVLETGNGWRCFYLSHIIL